MVRYSLVALCILLLGGCVGAYTFKLTEGTTNTTFYAEAVRSPFTGGVKLGGVVVAITQPQHDTDQYADTQELQYSVSGGSPPYTCRYRINGNLWNNLTDCAYQNVTFPLGGIILEVEATDSLGTVGNDIISFYMIGYIGLVPDIWWLGVVFVMLIILSGTKDEGKE